MAVIPISIPDAAMGPFLGRQPSAEDHLKDLVAFLDQAVATQTQRTTARSNQEQRTQEELVNAKYEIVRLAQRLAESEKQLTEERMSHFLLRLQHERSMELIAMTRGHRRAVLSATPQSAVPSASAVEILSPTERYAHSSQEYHSSTSEPSGCLERLLATLQHLVFDISD